MNLHKNKQHQNKKLKIDIETYSTNCTDYHMPTFDNTEIPTPAFICFNFHLKKTTCFRTIFSRYFAASHSTKKLLERPVCKPFVESIKKELAVEQTKLVTILLYRSSIRSRQSKFPVIKCHAV